MKENEEERVIIGDDMFVTCAIKGFRVIVIWIRTCAFIMV